MKAKIKRRKPKSLPASRPQAVKFGRRARRIGARSKRSQKNLAYFYLQLFVVLGVFAGISRCSPLAPSQSIDSLGRQPVTSSGAASQFNGQVGASVAAAVSPASPSRPAPAEDNQAEINIRVEIEVLDTPLDPRTPNSILRLLLTREERDNLLRRAEVPLSLRSRGEATGLLTVDEIQAKIRALRERGATPTRARLKIFVPNQSMTPTIQANRTGLLLGARVDFSGSDAQIKLGTIQVALGWNAFAAAVQGAQAVYLDIQ